MTKVTNCFRLIDTSRLINLMNYIPEFYVSFSIKSRVKKIAIIVVKASVHFFYHDIQLSHFHFEQYWWYLVEFFHFKIRNFRVIIVPNYFNKWATLFYLV